MAAGSETLEGQRAGCLAGRPVGGLEAGRPSLPADPASVSVDMWLGLWPVLDSEGPPSTLVET